MSETISPMPAGQSVVKNALPNDSSIDKENENQDKLHEEKKALDKAKEFDLP